MKTLIIGGSGFLGSSLVGSLNGSSQSTYHQNRIFPNQIPMDLADEASIRKCLAETKPDVVLHCGGLTNTDFCEANRDLANRVNCLGTEVLLKGFNGKVIYFSTDYVFDGEHAPYNEHSQTNPLNHYGKTKLAAERVVLDKPQNLVVRVSGLYGFNEKNNRFINGLRSRRVIKASQELISTPTYIGDITKAVPEFMDMSGILHFTGEQSFSRYDFAKLTVESLGLDTEVIAQESKGIARKPRNSSLVSVYSLRKTSVDEALKEIRRVI
jgi:dTDP-4-dehydrorhamnose reductase